MQSLKRVGIFAMALMMFAAIEVQAQPGGGGGRGGGRGGNAGMMAMRFVPVEQVLGFLAFDEKVALSADQLVKVRDALKTTHGKRAEIMKSLQGSSDRDSAMNQVRRLRSEMTQSLTEVLDANQVKVLQAYMQQMNQRGGGRGGQGGRPGGGNRRGGDGGGDGA